MYYWEKGDLPEAFERLYLQNNALKEHGEDIYLGEFCPESTLVLKRSNIEKSKFPSINVHCHLSGTPLDKTAEGVKRMDSGNVRAIVNLDGGLTAECTKKALEAYDHAYPGRFYTFINMETPDINEPDFNAKTRARIKESAACGARGIKLLKEMGLVVKDSSGKLILPDDDRLRVVWETAAELNMPVLYHIADPAAFFRPFDAKNERFEQLRFHPDWHFGKPGFPSFETLMECQQKLLLRNPHTTFILPHGASLVENLPRLAALLDSFPNAYFDISARIDQFSRMPYSSREFLIKYADRALFGTDGGYIGGNSLYYRILESDDEYFNPRDGSDSMGVRARFMGYGLYLPDDVLKNIYHNNFARMLGIPLI